MRATSISTSTPPTTWSHSGPTFSPQVRVQPKVTEWLADQEPGASLYRWGLLLGSITQNEITVEDVLPIQTRQQLETEQASPHYHQVIGLCGWGADAAALRACRERFAELFPQAGSVMLFATATSPGRKPQIQVFAQDGRDEPEPRSFLSNSTLTWILTVLAVALGAWLLVRFIE